MSLETNIDEIRQKVSGLDYAADAYLNYANSVTGASDTNVGDAIMSLAAGYGQGGGGLVIEKTKVGTVENRNGSLNQAANGIATFTVPTLDFDTFAFIAQDRSSIKIIPFDNKSVTIPKFSYFWSKYLKYTTYNIDGYSVANRSSLDETTFGVNYARLTGTDGGFLAGKVPFDIYIMKLVPTITKED